MCCFFLYFPPLSPKTLFLYVYDCFLSLVFFYSIGGLRCRQPSNSKHNFCLRPLALLFPIPPLLPTPCANHLPPPACALPQPTHTSQGTVRSFRFLLGCLPGAAPTTGRGLAAEPAVDLEPPCGHEKFGPCPLRKSPLVKGALHPSNKASYSPAG